MGISIYAENERSRRYPRKVILQLTCDAPHGFVPAPVGKFVTDEEWAYSKAMRKGWKESFVKGKRCFFCPGCSGKFKQAKDD